MRYQLVLQLPVSPIEGYDRLIELEDRIDTLLGSLGEVDGHDVGSGEGNVFVHTDYPQQVFDAMSDILESLRAIPGVKVAYRDFSEEQFTVLYPVGVSTFDLV